MAVQPHRKQFTVEEYYRMAETGVLGRDDRVELIDGEIVVMTPIGSAHAACVVGLTEFFAPRLGKRAHVRIQLPLRLNDLSEPEPDVALVRWSPTRYAAAHPGPAEALLVVEVADSSLDYDRTTKLGMYAGAGIPEYWVVSLPDRRLELYGSPAPDGYREVRHAGAGEQVAALALPDLLLDVSDIF